MHQRCLLNIFNRDVFAWVVTMQMIFALSACNKIVDAGAPKSSLSSDNVYENDATANSVLIGVYASLQSAAAIRGQTINSISLVTGLSADELTLHGGSANANTNLVAFYLNKLNSGNSTSTVQNLWNDLYSKIYIVNLALEKLANSTHLTPSLSQQLTGEAKFLRAFFYFHLVNLYGDVPLIVTSDYRTNSKLSRSPKEDVYKQIINDLKEAESLLSENFVGPDGKGASNERLRPNKYAAAALLARTYLYDRQWQNAEEQATFVINKSTQFSLTSLDSSFLKNTTEAIWQLQPVNVGWNTEDARFFLLPSTGPTSTAVEGYPVYISNQLRNAFEPNDQRKTKWIGNVTVTDQSGTVTYYYPSKYKSATLNAPVTEYEMVLRLAEQYLIRAEARAQQNNIGGAQSDLDVIRARATLSPTNAADLNLVLAAIQHERRVELFTEWGDRWMNLKRTGTIDAVMNAVAPEKGTSWSSNWQLYPIPLYDLAQNTNLVQNTGY